MEAKDNQKKQVLAEANARRGTLIINRSGMDDDDSVGAFDGTNDDPSSYLRLYECGHAFHTLCIKSYIQEKQNSQVVTMKMLNDQKCPWCYSDKFNIDL